MNYRTALTGGLLICLYALPLGAAEDPSQKTMRTLKALGDYVHGVGRAGSRGWELDYRRHKPGYALIHPREPLLLEPGAYRATFVLRRGHFPKKGLLNTTYGVFRLEIWDVTAKELLNQRELQRCDFSSANKYDRRWLEFSMRGREGHVIEPRIYWMGLSNGEVEAVEIIRFPLVSPTVLREKARRIEERLKREHLENGFVVSRKPDRHPRESGDPVSNLALKEGSRLDSRLRGNDVGEADETGDATTYTGWYVAALAWKYAVTKDELTYQALENGLQTLHNAIKGSPEHPLLTRFVDADGTPFPKSPSKDVYASFFFAYAAAFPHIRNEPLRKQMKRDAERIVNRFLSDGLTVKIGSAGSPQGGPRTLVSLTPYFTEAEIRDGIQKLLADKRETKKLIRAIKKAPRYLPFTELWSGMNEVVRALQKQDEEKLVQLTLPTMNGVFGLVERTRNVLREQYRDDLFPKRFRNQDYPGRKLSDLLTVYLKRFPPHRDGRRFVKRSDLRVLASNALISLNIVRAAQKLTQLPQFEEYLKANLYGQDSLLTCALDWCVADEEIMKLAAGNPAADRMRKGYLAALSLYQLIQAETNPAVKEKYRDILKRNWAVYRNEDNPMMAAIYLACADRPVPAGEIDFILRDLDLYPEDNRGLGEDYWKENGEKIAEQWGGGEYKGYAREPLPVSHRPKDSFLWQRNARRLSGDSEVRYPGTDYLFVYWLARYHGLIPAAAPQPTVKP